MGKPSVRFTENLIGRSTQKVLSPVLNFMAIEASGGIVLMIFMLLALFMANSDWASLYFSFISTPVSISVGGSVLNKNLLLLVNDGLMAIFFYLVGLEIKREILRGELSTPKKASFSIFAAIGGMLFPALIFLWVNRGGEYTHGWGVPMATDIAFAVGVLTLLGKRVSLSLKIFLLALAIVDDLGAILVIALFYTNEISTGYLGVAGLALFFLALLNISGIRNIAWGLALGAVTWFCFLKSGVHATIAGVLLAFLTPSYALDSQGKKEGFLLDRYIHSLHPWVAFGIMPIFAFFNAGVSFQGVSFEQLAGSPVVLGIALGLVLGNPIGILTMTYLAVRLKIAEFPKGVTWPQVLGVGCLAGIGFTMSLFISSLAFKGQAVESYSKMGILFGSGIAMTLGLSLLLIFSRAPKGQKQSIG